MGTKQTRKIEHEGKIYTVAELAKEFGINRRAIYGRLKAGYSANELIQPSAPRGPCVAPEWSNKTLVVQFPTPLSCVTGPMQPLNGVSYIATPGHSFSARSARQFYIIILENGWPLIVYPNEFTVIGEAPKEAIPYKGLRDFPKYRISKPYR